MRQQSLYIPLQPILMLVQIPGDVKWFTVLDRKDACFSIWFISHFSIYLPSSELVPSWLNATVYLDSIDTGILGQPTLVLPGPRKRAKGNISTRRGHSSVHR